MTVVEGFVEEFVLEIREAGAGVHHDDVGAVLLEDEAVVFFGGVLAAEVEDAELARCRGRRRGSRRG